MWIGREMQNVAGIALPKPVLCWGSEARKRLQFWRLPHSLKGGSSAVFVTGGGRKVYRWVDGAVKSSHHSPHYWRIPELLLAKAVCVLV